jgi:hypothetical protein
MIQEKIIPKIQRNTIKKVINQGPHYRRQFMLRRDCSNQGAHGNWDGGWRSEVLREPLKKGRMVACQND